MRSTVAPEQAAKDEDLTAGTVLMLADDLRFLGPNWAHRAPGTHFIVGGITGSGYMFSALNTMTGRIEHFMAERWVMDSMRVIGRIPQERPGCATCGCDCQDDDHAL